MSSEKAKMLFTKADRTLNCAETIAAAFGHEDIFPQMRQCGGGHAPDGICGALHAALVLAPESRREEIKRKFALEAKSVYCFELKNKHHTSCLSCVMTAATLLENAEKK